MFEILHHLFRRKIRTLFSILGVSIGVFALLVMGAMAEHFNLLASHFSEMFSNRLFVCEQATFWSGEGIISEDKAKRVEKIPGVYKVVPLLINKLRTEPINIITLPQTIVGINPDQLTLVYDKTFLAQGTWLTGKPFQAGVGEAVVGSDIATDQKLKLNDNLKNYPFKIKGIIKKTGSLEDKQVIVSLRDAQELFSRKDFVTSLVVIPQGGEDLDALAKKIKLALGHIRVVTPFDLENQIAQSLSVWNIIALGAALLAAITGALCIIVILLMAVNDRIPEIGLKKAIGASSMQIMEEYLGEAVVLSCGGWILGNILGIIFIKIFEYYSVAAGISLFHLTGRLIFLSLLWSVCIGVLSGLYPSWQAASIDPVRAMKKV